MKRNWVLLGLVVLCMTTLVCTPVSAFRSQVTMRSDYTGLRYQIICENADAWSTGQEYAVYITLTLLEMGTVLDFESLTLAIYLVTEIVQWDIITLNDPWSEIGDKIRFTAHFTVTPEQVNNSVWDIYQAYIYYQINQSVILEGGLDFSTYTNLLGPLQVGVSTLSFWTYWPYPPILLMMGIYYGGFFGLRKFNRRYEWFDGKTKKLPTDTQEESHPSSSDNYD